MDANNHTKATVCNAAVPGISAPVDVSAPSPRDAGPGFESTSTCSKVPHSITFALPTHKPAHIVSETLGNNPWEPLVRQNGDQSARRDLTVEEMGLAIRDPRTFLTPPTMRRITFFGHAKTRGHAYLASVHSESING